MQYFTNQDVVPGIGFKVICRDGQGALCGEYTGYWRPEKGCIMLYPAKGSYKYGLNGKKIINERELRRSR